MRPHCLTLDSGDLCFSIKALLKSWDSGSEKQTLLPVKERPDSAEPEPAEPAESAESAEPAEAAAAAEPEPSLQAWSSKLGIGWTLCFSSRTVVCWGSKEYFFCFCEAEDPHPSLSQLQGIVGLHILGVSRCQFWVQTEHKINTEPEIA